MSVTVTSINGSTPPASTTPTNPSQTLTQADFLKIMVAQFTQQDPLADGSDGSGGSSTSDYVNQLMSMTNLTTLQTMSGEQAQQLAESLPGDTVEVDNNGTYSTGAVQSARVDPSTGAVDFTVGGTEYPSSDLASIISTASETAANNGASSTTPATTP